jgi:glycosyl transferase, family 25
MLIEYLDQIYLIHLPHRHDRLRDMRRELDSIHAPLEHPKVSVPPAPIVTDADQFPSPGVRGNFLSHLQILKDARDRGHRAIMVLEDDAIFRAALACRTQQVRLVAKLTESEWGLCYLGHPLDRELAGYPPGLISYPSSFKWAHCYLVHATALTPLVDYLERTLERPAGHPEGGRMYIDGALSMFREQHRDVSILVANPALSVQMGSPSSLAGRRWFDRRRELAGLVALARRIRAEWWRLKVRQFVIS